MCYKKGDGKNHTVLSFMYCWFLCVLISQKWKRSVVEEASGSPGLLADAFQAMASAVLPTTSAGSKVLDGRGAGAPPASKVRKGVVGQSWVPLGDPGCSWDWTWRL